MNSHVCLLQGPAGADGDAGAKGEQGDPVSVTTCLVTVRACDNGQSSNIFWLNLSVCLVIPK